MGRTLRHRDILWIFVSIHRRCAVVFDSHIFIGSGFRTRNTHCTLVHSSTRAGSGYIRKKSAAAVCPKAAQYFHAYGIWMRTVPWLVAAANIKHIPVAINPVGCYTFI